MKRHICAGAGALLLALAGAGTATAGGLPVPGQAQLGGQSASLGDQSVGEQSNDAGVTQGQGNGNVNVSPALAVGGDASSWSAQGNGNAASAVVGQSNAVSQSQSVVQGQQGAGGSGAAGCCGGGGREAVQSVEGGDQSVGEQSNTADVAQSQGNGNLNISPAIAIGGDASTSNAQGNGNDAQAWVTQENAASQSQQLSQAQRLGTDGKTCCGSSSQSATQEASPGDQSVGEQSNDAGVTQRQGNGNVNVSPAIAVGGDASSWSAQGNGNAASAVVGQSNAVSQSQSVVQGQQGAGGSGAAGCCGGGGREAVQSVEGGDQSVGEQSNTADVAQSQGNGNLNISPAIAIGGKPHDTCASTCSGKVEAGHGGASTWNAQGNGNQAAAWVTQGNTATQTQAVTQDQALATSGGCCEPDRCKAKSGKPCGSHPRTDCPCGGHTLAGTQVVTGGDQTIGTQKNDADVTQKQGNRNVNRSPAFARGGENRMPYGKSVKGKKGGSVHGPEASTSNLQGNGNVAGAWLTQGNQATQSQSTSQSQQLLDAPKHGCKHPCRNACRNACSDGCAKPCKEVMPR